MLTLALKLIYYEMLAAFGRLKNLRLALLASLPAVVVETRCAIRMEGLANRLGRMHDKIMSFESHIHQGHFTDEIDADRSIRDMLRGLKQDIRTVRCEVASLEPVRREGYGALRLRAALARLHRVAEQTYAAADRLLWEIAQHDGP
jgi:hypothetical protein